MDDLLSRARGAIDRTEWLSRRCEAFTYAGLEAERAGQGELAGERYARAVETGAADRLAYHWARRRLAAGGRPLGW